MSATRDLMVGLATLISTAGIGVVFHADGSVPSDGETPIYFKIMPAAPDRVVVLNVIPLTDNISVPLGLVMVQVACRSLPNNPLDVDDLADSIFGVLQGLTDVWFGATHAVQAYRYTSIPMGQDEATRYERADTYHIDLDYPATVLRPVGGTY